MNKSLTLRMADTIRVLSMEAVHKAQSGHQGMPMGMADVATVLWTKFLTIDPTKPNWPNRDRFVLSAGHGSMLLYALMHLTGFKSVSMDDIRNFRQWGSSTPGHPEYGHTEGVECTTGPLGQGLATAVGMAMAERHMGARFGSLCDHYTYVIAGDGCLMEGVSHEAISLAGRLKLSKLIVLWDDNNVTIDGWASLAETGDQCARFKAAGWAVKSVDGHNHKKIASVLKWAKTQNKPVMIACKTKVSKGAGSLEGDKGGHGYNLFDDQIKNAREAMDYHTPAFSVEPDVKKAFEKAAKAGRKVRKEWEQTHEGTKLWHEYELAMKGQLPDGCFDALEAHIKASLTNPVAEATRQSSGAALASLTPYIPAMIGGSADLTGSVNTMVKGMKAFDAPDYEGRYVHYGVREFGQSAALNGMALHGGIIPYAGTFFVFSDYSRPAIRLSALMGLKVINVLTHDSIGVGEDGPTHQPVEHLASFRAMPGLLTFRPADRVETAESWQLALSHDGPSLMVLSRQKTPQIRTQAGKLSQFGAYELSPASSEAQVSLFASGTEVALALEAQKALEAKSIPTRVISTPCWALFDAQNADYQKKLIGNAKVNIAIEAGISFGWEKFIGREGHFIGMKGFGASAPASVLFEKFGITSKAVTLKALEALGHG